MLEQAAASDAGVLLQLLRTARGHIAREGAALLVDDHQASPRRYVTIPAVWSTPFAFKFVDVLVESTRGAAANNGYW